MREVPVQSLRAGLSFSEPVYIEENNLLVPAGIAIRKKDLERLNSWGIATVKTDGEPVVKPAALPPKPAVPKKPSDAPVPGGQTRSPAAVFSTGEIPENSDAYRSYVDLIERLGAVFDRIAAGAMVEARSVDTITGLLLQVIREQRDRVMGFILGGEVSGHILAKNSINTAILSGLIALELKLPNHKLVQMVTGALLHDVGMLRLPREILDKRGGLSESELQRMQAHPLYSYKIVCKELRYPEDVGLIVIQHHERLDGDGYPRRLSGAQIDMGARIVSVTDAFEAMVSEKPYRNSLMGNQAIKNLLSDNTRRFDSDVLRAFIQTMGIYPIGSYILLNNGAVARVTDVQGDAPLRPKIRIVIDESGKKFRRDEGPLIDLLSDKTLFIARALDPRELVKKHG
ncbi:MAG: HD-GYP domain-containing protein [Spirochaetaceae bacterium]|jgi:HD-GYP domain-containing protein (c-di-GMP phosphodiesterase class II)|nr:HD-GYP domain-containing protein [Spirochaetaceae bacterium]